MNRQWWPAILRRLRGWWSGPDLRRVADIPELAESERWAIQYLPLRDDPIYNAVRSLAERSYQELVDLADNLDRKSDDLMKTAAALAAALAAAGRIAGATALLEHPRMILASVSRLIITLLICARTRTPINKAGAMRVRTALQVADLGMASASAPATNTASELATEEAVSSPGDRMLENRPGNSSENQMHAIVAASFEFASVGVQILIQWKASQLQWATNFFIAALVLLIAALWGTI